MRPLTPCEKKKNGYVPAIFSIKVSQFVYKPNCSKDEKVLMHFKTPPNPTQNIFLSTLCKYKLYIKFIESGLFILILIYCPCLSTDLINSIQKNSQRGENQEERCCFFVCYFFGAKVDESGLSQLHF